LTHSSKLLSIILLILITYSLTTTVYGGLNPQWLSGISWYQYPITEFIVGAYGDFIVVDPDYGPSGKPWTSDDIEWIKASGKKIIAYLNIGFAENWRDYWNETWNETFHPEWLVWVEYPGWPGEYFVKYWHPSAWETGGWVDILKHELEKIISMGFDGVRLDNIDSCKYWEDPASIGLAGVLPQVDNASTWMIYLVGNLSSYAKSLNPDFIVQANMGGALDLLGNDTFLASIDVVEREEVWYANNTPVASSETSEALYWLRYARDHGKKVFVMDYAWSPDYLLDELSKASKEGFYIYVASDYELDKLPGYLPVYSGIDSAGDIVTWSYHGIIGDQIRGEWDVYVAKITENGLVSVKRVTGDGSDEYNPSVTVNPGKGEVFIVYNVYKSGAYSVEAVVLSRSKFNVKNYVSIASGSPGSVSYIKPSTVYCSGYYYVVFLGNDTGDYDVYVAVIDSSTYSKVKTFKITDNLVDDEYPVAVGVGDKVAVLWRDNTSALHLALVDVDRVEWSIELADNVKPYRYGAVYVRDKGILVVYEENESATATLVSFDGVTIAEKKGLPDITWRPKPVFYGDDIVVYPSMYSIVTLRIKSIELLETRSIPVNTVAGSTVSVIGDQVYVASVSLKPGNNINIYPAGAPLNPAPEPSLLPLVIVLALTTVLLLTRRK